MNGTWFWELVQAELDARRDPLDNEDIVEFLNAHPDKLEKFANLRDGVRALSTAGSGFAARRPRSRRTLLTAACLLVLLPLCVMAYSLTDPGDDMVTPDVVQNHRVLSFAIEIETDSPEVRSRTWTEGNLRFKTHTDLRDAVSRVTVCSVRSPIR